MSRLNHIINMDLKDQLRIHTTPHKRIMSNRNPKPTRISTEVDRRNIKVHMSSSQNNDLKTDGYRKKSQSRNNQAKEIPQTKATEYHKQGLKRQDDITNQD